MSVVTLRPSGDGTATGWGKNGGVSFAGRIVDDPDSNDGDTSYVESPTVVDGTMFVELADVPADFDPDAINSITIKVAHRRINLPNMAVDAGTVNAFLTRADETTAISTTPTAVNSPIQAGYELTSFTPSPTGTHTVAEWNGARLALVFDHTNVQAADDFNHIRITAVEVTIDYEPAAAAEHATTGALVGPGAVVAGAASSATTRPSSGALTGPGAAIAGTAARTRAHATTGVLAGAGSALAGAAARTHVHPTSGALTGPGAEVAGTAAREGAPVTHATSGALAGQGATVAGAASSATTRPSSGALVGPGAVVAGTAARTRVHATSGVLVALGAAIAGSAAREGAPVTHATSGELFGAGASVSGAATGGVAELPDSPLTHTIMLPKNAVEDREFELFARVAELEADLEDIGRFIDDVEAQGDEFVDVFNHDSFGDSGLTGRGLRGR